MGHSKRERSGFGELLREWRKIRGYSQLELSLDSGVSARHLSFLETGRSRPTQQMVETLAQALQIPLRGRNELLMAAGFNAAFSERDLSDLELEAVRYALERILRAQEPFPAIVLNRRWEILRANDASEWLTLALLGGTSGLDTVGEQRPNLLHWVLDPNAMRPRIRNWEVVAKVLLSRLKRQLRVPDPDPYLVALREEVLRLDGVESLYRIGFDAPVDFSVLIPLVLDVRGQDLEFFSTLATLGTPQDVTLDELLIESFFPANAACERAWLSLFPAAGTAATSVTGTR